MNITGSPQLKNGRWYAVVRVPQKNGKDKQVWRTLGLTEKAKKSEVDRAFNKFLYEQQEGIATLDKDSFVACIDKWLDHKEFSLRSTTYLSYRKGFDKYISPFFTRKKTILQEVKRQDIQAFVDYLIGEVGLAPQTVKKYLGIVRGTLNDAEKDELIRKNPAKFVEVPPDIDSDVGRALSPDEVQKLLEASKGHPVHIAIFLAAYLGLRRSEIAGLRWEHVNLDARTLYICETTTQTYGKPVHEAKTKSKASKREIYLSDTVYDFLRELQHQQKLDKDECKAQYIDNDFVCKYADGKILQPQVMTKNFKRCVEKADIDECRLHDLRHTAVTLALDGGASVKDVQKLMGHSQASTTMEIYAHASRDSSRETANRLTAALSTCLI